MKRGKKGRALKRGRAKILAGRQQRGSEAKDLEMVGTFKLHREGNYGFILPEDPEAKDVFIPGRRMGDVLDGDKVRVRYWQERGGKRLEGAVEEVLERGKKWWVGTLTKIDAEFYVEVSAARRPLLFWVDGRELKNARVGGSVAVEVLSYPVQDLPGKARVLQILGARGDEKTETDIIILEHQLPTDFPDPVLREAKELQAGASFELSEDRQDLRKLPLVTIDGETARDFDDAICVKKEEGGFRLWVAIADVSHFVKPGSLLDQEALSRGTSVYFTDKVLPMLPEALSNDLCSLRPHEPRYTVVAEMFFNSQGVRQQQTFYRALITSQARLTYSLVARGLLKEEPEAKESLGKSLPMLQEAYELFQILRKLRMQRGSLDFDLPEPEIILDLEAGGIENIVKAERSEAHMLIEEFMIAANEAVGEALTATKQATLYRIHSQPEEKKVFDFQTLLHNLKFQTRLPARPKPSDFGRVLAESSDHPEALLVQHLLLRSLPQAVYSIKNEGHFGLASKCYTHFTSPIRRYPDLVIHRLLTEHLINSSQASPARSLPHNLKKKALTDVASHCSRRERIAMEAEWEALDLMTALFMQRFIGEEFSGHIVRVKKFGFFVELDDYFVQGLVLSDELARSTQDQFVFDEKRHQLRSRHQRRTFKIGMEVKIQVAKVDILERKVYFTFLG